MSEMNPDRVGSRVRPVWRQGDVFLVPLESPPSGEWLPHGPVLAEGEVTGHSHRLERAADARVLSGVGGSMILEVLGEEATIVHEEHGPVRVPRGLYEVRIQREYHPQKAVPRRKSRPVMD